MFIYEYQIIIYLVNNVRLILFYFILFRPLTFNSKEIIDILPYFPILRQNDDTKRTSTNT